MSMTSVHTRPGRTRLLWDVGHQCYAHKMLTGRAGKFATLRKKGSVSGFPNPDESAYDLFAVGHAGTAISTAVGHGPRRPISMDKPGNVVAVVGDASIVNGLAFEGLNNAGTLKRQLLIILNDNGMSISQPAGRFQPISGAHPRQHDLRGGQAAGGEIRRTAAAATSDNRRAGLASLSPTASKARSGRARSLKPWASSTSGRLDGHDLPGLIDMLAEIKHVQAPVLLHVKTVKGNGYEIASSEPTKFHSPSAFQCQRLPGRDPQGPAASRGPPPSPMP